MKTVTKKKSAAEILAAEINKTLPVGYEASECLMVNMANVHGEQPEFVMVSPMREVFRQYKATGKLPELRQQTRLLYETMKKQGGNWLSIGFDISTIYIRPDDTLSAS